ncbi:hypothetical protein CW354_20520 [Marinicaulis flavus]|uniref:Uncharacterized protein n=1 Tax=Hyphococcus luteus TaxID=2058213 RepID=A0A2S7JYL5_9PROT|nr:hypothetical protein CW354_20520 [Marinicaulis flavus]
MASFLAFRPIWRHLRKNVSRGAGFLSFFHKPGGAPPASGRLHRPIIKRRAKTGTKFNSLNFIPACAFGLILAPAAGACAHEVMNGAGLCGGRVK